MELFKKFTSKLVTPSIFNPDSSIYHLDTLEDIESIPVPTKPFKHNCDFTKSIEYVLQRKATQYKKEGKMDLAIACLRKSNQIFDFSPMGYSEKDYLRLAKYLRSNGQLEEAERAEQEIYNRHPEFKDKRISNLVRIQGAIQSFIKSSIDLVVVFTNNRCHICKKYNKKIYSISGNNKKYPKLPDKISKEGGFCPDCILLVTMYYED